MVSNPMGALKIASPISDNNINAKPPPVTTGKTERVASVGQSLIVVVKD